MMYCSSTRGRKNPYLALSHYQRKKQKNIIQILKMLFIMVIIMLICTVISIVFYRIEMFESNIIMVYLLGTLLFSYLAEGYIYSIGSSVCAVILYNFFFTEPIYTLKVNNPDYIITFLVMFIVGFITSSLTIKIKTERQQVEDREKYISALYNIGKKLLDVKNEEDLTQISAEELSKQFHADVMVQLFKTSGESFAKNVYGRDVFSGILDQSACLETFQSGSPCGQGTTLFSEANAYYKPIASQYGIMGVIGIALKNSSIISQEQLTFMDVIIPQIVVVLERQNLAENQKRTQLEIQKERLRSDMLRSISHDFRTPLAGIMGLASTAIDNYGKISDEIRKNFLQTIYEDADWLSELVENILQTTRFDEGKIKLNLDEEAAEEIITDAVSHVKKHAKWHSITVNIPDEIILIKVDAILLRQVIVNILNNSINYSPEGSEITVTLYREDSKVVFEIKDNGPGILQEDLNHIFDRYHHSSSKNVLYRKGMGLGLSLCKSIIEAHGGKISISNCETHGTIVNFYVHSEQE